MTSARSLIAAAPRFLWNALPAGVRARYLAWRNPPRYPSMLQVEQVFRCNLKCVMCVHGNGQPEVVPDMSLDFFKGLIDQFNQGVNEYNGGEPAYLEIQGVGEPLLHTDTLAMVEYARERDLITFFVTNMTIMTEKIAESLCRAEHSIVTASIDSIDPAIFQDIRRGVKFGVLEKALGNIKMLSDTKKRLGKSKPEIRVNSILMRRTLGQVPELVARLRELGVQRINFVDLNTMGIPQEMTFSNGDRVSDQSLQTLPTEEALQVLREIKALSTPECIVEVPEDWGGISGWQRKDAILTCDDLWEKPFITAEGIVKPCCWLSDRVTLPMGDLRENTFDEIWFGKAYQSIRRQHITGDTPGPCKKCPRLVRTVALNSVVAGSRGEKNPLDKPFFLGDAPFSSAIKKHSHVK